MDNNNDKYYKIFYIITQTLKFQNILKKITLTIITFV